MLGNRRASLCFGPDVSCPLVVVWSAFVFDNLSSALIHQARERLVDRRHRILLSKRYPSSLQFVPHRRGRKDLGRLRPKYGADCICNASFGSVPKCGLVEQRRKAFYPVFE